MLDASLPPAWPDAELTDILPGYVATLAEDPDALGYGIWLLVERDGRRVVGSAGFLGRPADDGTVELGYGVAAAHRNRGYATEAVRALVSWARQQEGVERVIAHCDSANLGSLRVLAKAELEQVDEIEGLTLWATG